MPFDYLCEYERISSRYHCAVDQPDVLVASVQQYLDSCDASDTLSDTVVSTVAEQLYTRSVYNHQYERYAVATLLDRLYASVPADVTFPVVQMNNTFHKSDPNQVAPLLDPRYSFNVMALSQELQDIVQWERDLSLSYFGFVTLQSKYLLHQNHPVSRVVERPQHMYLRVAVTAHQNRIVLDRQSPLYRKMLRDIRETYDELSLGNYTHATPVLTNSGTIMQQLASCFLAEIKGDSLDGIMRSLSDCAHISKGAGGIGMNINKVRSEGSYIHGTNGFSHGVPSMLKVYDALSVYVDQGGNKRPGAIAMYMEPWHMDVLDFIKLRRQTGNHTVRVNNLFLGLWVPDLFMRRVEQDATWTLFSPDDVPHLLELWGADFDRAYELQEQLPGRKQRVRARELMSELILSQIETGMPYMLYKDACNRKSNQQNLGTIKCSNLCTEIVQYSSPDEIAVCNLASVALPRFVGHTTDGRPYFDYAALGKTVRRAVKNMDSLIDVTSYPVPETRVSNLSHRPIGLGVQGLADVFLVFGCAWGDELSRSLNREIFECIQYHALMESCRLAKRLGRYKSYETSPAARGVLQMDWWPDAKYSGMFDWGTLRRDIQKWGLRNSLLTTVMPTATTSHLLGNSISIEPYSDNIYKHRTNCGEFVVVNRHLEQALRLRGLFEPRVVDRIVSQRGSVQNIPEIPQDVKRVFRTVYEVSQRVLLEMSAERAPFIDQSQSLNIFLLDDDKLFQKIYNCHMTGWRLGLKTGSYYIHVINKQLHALPSYQAKEHAEEEDKVCSRTCDSCHS